MTTQNHTPGPWKYSFESVDPEWAVVHNTLGGPVIANVNADHRQEANARLIAAAPAMLEALLSWERARIDGGVSHADLFEAAWQKTAAALALATKGGK